MSENKKHGSQQSVNQAIKSICDIMRRANCQGAMQYVPELTWILFLRILDEMETQEAEHAQMQGVNYSPSLSAPYRWQDWAAPFDEVFFKANPENDSAQGWKRYQLQKNETVKTWLNSALIPHLKSLEHKTFASERQKVISEIMSGVDSTRIDTDYNLLMVFDKVHELSAASVDNQHVFTLSQVYEGLLLSMGEKGNDGGQFFTPREIIRMMIKVVNPQIGQTVYDPCCGTGGFLAQAMEYMAGKDDKGNYFLNKTATEIDRLKHKTFYGREKDNQVYPIALAKERA
jgi:type I restriction enzyme M protein